MKNIKPVLLLMTTITLLFSCTKKEIKPELLDTKSRVIKDLPGDVGNTVGSGNEFTLLF